MIGIIWSRLFDAALRPGRRLMSSLHLPTKLGLMGLLLAVPVCVLLADVLSAARADLAILERERAGVTVARAMYRLTADLQALRAAATHRGTSRDPAQDLPAATSRLQATVAELDQSLAAVTAFEVLDEWSKLRPLALELTASPQGLSRSASFAGVGAVIDRAAVMLSLVGERSELLFDPKPDTFFLMDIVLERLPPLAESAARLGDYGVPVINRGEASNRDRWAMAAFADNLLRQQASVAARLDSLARADVQPPATWLAVVTSTQTLAASTNEAFAGDQIAQDSAALANATDAVVATVHRLSGDALTELDRRLAKREVEHRYAMLASMAAAMLGILGVLYLAASFFLSFRDSLRGLVGAVRAMAAGDLSQRITPVGTDELAGMAIDLETTSGKLSALVAEIRSSAVRVDQAGTEVSRDGQALSSRTETQASGLRQAVASVRQLSAAVAANTAVVTALNDRAITLGTQGLSCNEVMARSVQTMEQLDQSVRRVGEINAVIDDIAFQTNLLSLNASVEAARAGEQGKGFGVVAAEVRELSLRCAEAAAEVRELIDQTAGHAGLSRDSLTEASNLLNSLVGGIGAVSDGLKQVSGVGVEQSRDLESVMHSVNELDDITQQNAQAVATSAKASGSLAAQAAMLRTSVGTIQLRQGSADEARSLVERAMSRIALSGWEAAVADFNRRDGGFADRDLFIFAVDSEDRYIAMSAKPELVGSSIYDAPNMPAALADEYLRLARAACAKGGGWIDYEMLDIATHQPIVKSAFIADLGDGAFLGASVQRMSDASLTAAST